MTSFCELYQQQTAGLGPVHTNPAIFETAIFFLQESTIRPQETSKSAIQKGILLKPLTRDRFKTPSTRIRVNIYIYNCAVPKKNRLV